MLHFECDYLEGAHPRILEKLSATNLDQTPGYGADKHCERAAELIRKACGAPDAQVWFLVGGTQTNATVIRSILRNYEGVLSADTGHITGHEAGAIEASGHKVLTLPEKEGKISAETVEAAMQKSTLRFIPDSSTSRTRRSTARSTRSTNSRPFAPSATAITCRSTLTGRGSATALRPKRTT